MKHLDQYLKERDGRWHYVRRVPSDFREIDPRGTIRSSLKTSSIEVARARRDAMAEADEHFWSSLISDSDLNGLTPQPKTSPMHERYQAARKRALARGFVYRPAPELVREASTVELMQRLEHVAATKIYDEKEAEAVLGTAKSAAHTMTDALELYLTQIAAGTLKNKSAVQKRNYEKPKQRAVANFVSLFGNLSMDEITRTQAREFYDWWTSRLFPKCNEKPLSADSANRDLSNLRNLFQEYWIFEGEETRENPFRNLRFKGVTYKDIPPFSDPWVQKRILKPDLFSDLNREAALIIYAMIETGCRPSEIANLMPEHIQLGAAVPHIQIRSRQDRSLKTKSSVRDIPLVGISKLAFDQAPIGFPHYRENGNLLSNSLMKAFRARNLFENKDQRIYSFRHSFEKRMLEAGLDYGLRCLLMGHQNTRPSYGDGGSMEFRKTELLRIAHPVSTDLAGAISTI